MLIPLLNLLIHLLIPFIAWIRMPRRPLIRFGIYLKLLILVIPQLDPQLPLLAINRSALDHGRIPGLIDLPGQLSHLLASHAN